MKTLQEEKDRILEISRKVTIIEGNAFSGAAAKAKEEGTTNMAIGFGDKINENLYADDYEAKRDLEQLQRDEIGYGQDENEPESHDFYEENQKWVKNLHNVFVNIYAEIRDRQGYDFQKADKEMKDIIQSALYVFENGTGENKK